MYSLHKNLEHDTSGIHFNVNKSLKNKLCDALQLIVVCFFYFCTRIVGIYT